jgi:hypothetical protein
MLYRDILGIFQRTKESNFSRFQKKMCFFEFFEAFFESFFNQKSPLFYKKIERKSTFHTSSLIFYTKKLSSSKKKRDCFSSQSRSYIIHIIYKNIKQINLFILKE